MNPRLSLIQLGKLVGDDLFAGRMTEGSRCAGDALAASPKSLMLVLELVIAEGRKKQPNEKLLTGLLFMIGTALDGLRMMIEGRHATAAAVVQDLRDHLAAAARAGHLEPGLIMLIGRQFAAAKLDLGDELRDIMVELSARDDHADPQGTPVQLEDHYHELAEALHHDTFAIHAELTESAESFAPEQRVGLIASVVFSKEGAVRESALGWLLDRNGEIGSATAALMADAARQGLVSPRSCNRMVLLRSWLPESRREPVDAAIRAARKSGVGAAPEKEPDVRQTVLSGYDGAGAQSAFVLVKEGRSFTLASLLLKQGQGVKDAWVRRKIRRADADEMLGHIHEEVEHFPSSLHAIETCLANALAINLMSRTPPPFGLIDFVETVGLRDVRPQRLTGDAVLDDLLADIPLERKSEADVARAVAASQFWPMIYTAMQSWFETGAHVDAILSGARTKKKRVEAVFDRILPGRRARWAELLAWTAMAVRGTGDDTWGDLTLVAHELRGERPLQEIPLAAWIARTTVEAFIHRAQPTESGGRFG